MSKLTKEERLLWDTLKYSYDRSDVIRQNPEILHHIEISKKLGRITEPLGSFIIWLAERRAGRGMYQSRTYNEDMIGHAIMHMTKVVLKFNANKSDNPFAFLVTVTSGAFCNYLNHEKRQEDIKQNMLEEQEEIAKDNV